MAVEPHRTTIEVVDELKIKFSGIDITIRQEIHTVVKKTNIYVSGTKNPEVKQKVEKMTGGTKLSWSLGNKIVEKIQELLTASVEQCPTCEGKGGYNGFDDIDPESLHHITCWKCNGSGKVVKKE